jgi:L-alanine-DL-glutamate epimerase-like enolase superfamily enzyme
MSADVIAHVEAIPLQLPLRRPVAFSTRRLTSRSFVIVRVTTEAGATGMGYTYGGRLIATAVDLELAPHIIGRDPGPSRRSGATSTRKACCSAGAARSSAR